MKNIIILFAIVVLLGGGAWLWYANTSSPSQYENENGEAENIDNMEEETDNDTDEEETEAETDQEYARETTIGNSVGGNDIAAYHFGTGDNELLFIGGIHGGYSYNTSLVAYELIDLLSETPATVPESVTVTIIPVLNPDGLELVTGSTGRFTPADVSTSQSERVAGRFNANEVDLNRNFDCQWQAEGTWQSRTVSGGEAPFSEPEAVAVRDYVTSNSPEAVVVWYSAAGGVYASSCNNGILPGTQTLLNTYAEASDYPAYDSFDFYAITGDLVNWLASENIPAISVLLSDRQNTEWSKNRAGITAVINAFAE